MSKKICLGCGLGCGTVLILLILGFIFLIVLLYIPPTVYIEHRAIGYIIEHVDEFKDEINAMGYEVRVAHTVGERLGEDFKENKYNNGQTKIGYEERGILILSNDKEKIQFDIGFDWYDLYREDGIKITMGKDYFHDGVLRLNAMKYTYPIRVSISGEGFTTKSNKYDTDFIGFWQGIKGENLRDKQIKEHISAEELRAIYERCIGLQEKLVELYKAKKG